MIRTPSSEEVDARLREASELTRLCLSLPRLTTPGEERALRALDLWLGANGPRPSDRMIRAAFAVLWARKQFARIGLAAERMTEAQIRGDDRIDTFVFHARELLAAKDGP